jgi:hypothetical protein
MFCRNVIVSQVFSNHSEELLYRCWLSLLVVLTQSLSLLPVMVLLRRPSALKSLALV